MRAMNGRYKAKMEDNLKLQWSELADTLGQTGLDILGGAPVTVTEKRFAEPKVLAIMLMSRTLSNFRGVFTLIENCLVERPAFWCAAVSRIPSGWPGCTLRAISSQGK